MIRRSIVMGVVGVSGAVALAGEPGPIFDPYGDAVAVFGSETPLLDIESMDMRYDSTEIVVSMSFYTPIAAPSAERPNSIAGFIEMDTDQDPRTGHPTLQNIYSPPFAEIELGADFYCDLFTEIAHPGYVDVILDLDIEPVATVPITFNDFGFQFVIPLDALEDDGLLDFSTVIGTIEQPTDALEVVGQSVPAPASMTLAAVAGLIGARRRR